MIVGFSAPGVSSLAAKGITLSMVNEEVPVTIDLSVPERPGRRLGRRRRKTSGGVWTYEVAVDGADGAVLTLRCSEPATVDQSGLHRKFWLVEGGNIVVAADDAFRLASGPEDHGPQWTGSPTV